MSDEIKAMESDAMNAPETSEPVASEVGTGEDTETIKEEMAAVEEVKIEEPKPEETKIAEPEPEETETEISKGYSVEDARKKLEEEKKQADNPEFAEPVIDYLLKRIEESAVLVQDIMQEHKTWKKCFDYIFNQAKKKAKNNRAAVRDDVVYEWAEDYYHKDDKAEEEKKAKEAKERQKRIEESKKKAAEREKERKAKNKTKTGKKADGSAKEEKKQEAPKPKSEPKPKNNAREIEGQMDFFSMMGL